MFAVDNLKQNYGDTVRDLIATHGTYYDAFMQFESHIMFHGDSPLPVKFRHYIAILASSRYACRNLVKEEETKFLKAGGDPLWLHGIDEAPSKIQNIDNLNRKMAHCPWTINQSDIRSLIIGENDGAAKWSLSELTHCILICAHFHSLSTFVYGTAFSDLRHSSPSSEGETPIVHPNQKVNNYSETSTNETCKEEEGYELLCLEKRINEFIATQNVDQSGSPTSSSIRRSSLSDVAHYVKQPDFVYYNIIKKSYAATSWLILQEFSWTLCAFPAMETYFFPCGSLLDKRFNSSLLTSRTSKIDSRCCCALWAYVQFFYGILDEDYDYRQINSILNPLEQNIIKVLVCFPDRVKRKHLDDALDGLNELEKVKRTAQSPDEWGFRLVRPDIEKLQHRRDLFALKHKIHKSMLLHIQKVFSFSDVCSQSYDSNFKKACDDDAVILKGINRL